VGCGSGFADNPRLCRIAALTSWLVIGGFLHRDKRSREDMRRILQIAIRGVKRKISDSPGFSGKNSSH